ncbi:hypothetical protein FBUS_06658 [Fasciolopsis buskii]|uniref:Uncharacterized protein n=1 Tax=Fasciolopsis buskii TaxID=27845 RepID=A0A8E0S191_9TREM|nr:hypothetical protein FBUS_06658 [Fasciolopsis buski]
MTFITFTLLLSVPLSSRRYYCRTYHLFGLSFRVLPHTASRLCDPFRFSCFPSSIVVPLCLPFILLNGLTLVLVGAYMSARPDRSREELLGFGMTSIPGLVCWSVLSTAPRPGLHPHWQFTVWYYLVITQASANGNLHK